MGERSGRDLGCALLREGPHGVVVELPRQLRLRQRVTKGPGSRAAGVVMAFKLIESAQSRWRAVNGPHLVALVRAGAAFKNGKLIERPDGSEGRSASRVTRRSTGLDYSSASVDGPQRPALCASAWVASV